MRNLLQNNIALNMQYFIPIQFWLHLAQMIAGFMMNATKNNQKVEISVQSIIFQITFKKERMKLRTI